MSRHYEMHVRVEAVDQDRLDEIEKACTGEWNFENEPWRELSDSDGKEVIAIEWSGRDNLCGGEGDDEFALRLAQAIWAANNGFCLVRVGATYLENMPFESYELGKDEYDAWKEGEDDE